MSEHAAPPSSYVRYVALGDSQTEGIGDGDDTVGHRGWADRLAEQLTDLQPELGYANLAARGRLAAQVRAGQLAPALALRPDLATVFAGVNDLIRPRYDADAVVSELEEMFAALTDAGATVVTLTFPDIGRIAPLARGLRPRVRDFNTRVRAAAARHGVLVADTAGPEVTTDPRMWSADRLHASPLGHTRIAAAVADALRLPGSDTTWTRPLPTPAPRPTLAGEARWAATFLGPWALRRLRDRSSGDTHTAKRPHLTPLAHPAHEPSPNA
ncbi:SGNH/GDSL hydrolase family protein [Streptomyces apocyni]|uniref:SGNH/GDSL hydrolase family protein n=1 Tax=Streptomyces apocyni TaxID=2654677 RepID=UPI0012E9C04F|nr:SGNH/GDSL hydrolase family protein [Streptomyces apocyni]